MNFSRVFSYEVFDRVHISLRKFPYKYSLGKFSLGNSKISTSSNSLAPMIFVLSTLPNLFLFDFQLISDKSSFTLSSHISLRNFPYKYTLGKFSLGNSKNSTSSNSLANSIFLLRTLPNLFLINFYLIYEKSSFTLSSHHPSQILPKKILTAKFCLRNSKFLLMSKMHAISIPKSI